MAQILTWTGSGYGSGTSRTLYLNGAPYGTAQVPKEYEGREEAYFRSQYNPQGIVTREQAGEQAYEHGLAQTRAQQLAERARHEAYAQEQRSLKSAFVPSGREAPRNVVGIEQAKQSEREFIESRNGTIQPVQTQPGPGEYGYHATPTRPGGIKTEFAPTPASQYFKMPVNQIGVKPTIGQYGAQPGSIAEKHGQTYSIISGLPLVKQTYKLTDKPTLSKYTAFGFNIGDKFKPEKGKTYIQPALFGKTTEIKNQIETKKASQRDINTIRIGATGVALLAPVMPKAFIVTEKYQAPLMQLQRVPQFKPKLRPTMTMERPKVIKGLEQGIMTKTEFEASQKIAILPKVETKLKVITQPVTKTESITITRTPALFRTQTQTSTKTQIKNLTKTMPKTSLMSGTLAIPQSKIKSIPYTSVSLRTIPTTMVKTLTMPSVKTKTLTLPSIATDTLTKTTTQTQTRTRPITQINTKLLTRQMTRTTFKRPEFIKSSSLFKKPSRITKGIRAFEISTRSKTIQQLKAGLIKPATRRTNKKARGKK